MINHTVRVPWIINLNGLLTLYFVVKYNKDDYLSKINSSDIYDYENELVRSPYIQSILKRILDHFIQVFVSFVWNPSKILLMIGNVLFVT